MGLIFTQKKILKKQASLAQNVQHSEVLVEPAGLMSEDVYLTLITQPYAPAHGSGDGGI